jgi:hypothetical protein
MHEVFAIAATVRRELVNADGLIDLPNKVIGMAPDINVHSVVSESCQRRSKKETEYTPAIGVNFHVFDIATDSRQFVLVSTNWTDWLRMNGAKKLSFDTQDGCDENARYKRRKEPTYDGHNM